MLRISRETCLKEDACREDSAMRVTGVPGGGVCFGDAMMPFARPG